MSDFCDVVGLTGILLVIVWSSKCFVISEFVIVFCLLTLPFLFLVVGPNICFRMLVTPDYYTHMRCTTRLAWFVFLSDIVSDFEWGYIGFFTIIPSFRFC